MYSFVFLTSIFSIFLSSIGSITSADLRTSSASFFLCSTSASICTFLSSSALTSSAKASRSAFSSFTSSSISKDLCSMSDICISLISISFSFQSFEFCQKILLLFVQHPGFFFGSCSLRFQLIDNSIDVFTSRDDFGVAVLWQTHS